MAAATSPLELRSSDQGLREGFLWAREQALAYVFHGDPVGDWYEAALPGRQAFCMRDVSHQCTGAASLGLRSQNLNMLKRFAENISPSRDWCSYWEIDRRNLPCPADYRDDAHFWYNLPANLDVLSACWRQYLWTGDRAYLDDGALRFFYDATMSKYVPRWDRDGDGIPEHYPEYGYRGLSSYDEAETTRKALVAGDLVAVLYAAYRDFASIMDLDGNAMQAAESRRRAGTLRESYNRDWWLPGERRFAGMMRQDMTYDPREVEMAGVMGLLSGIVAEGEKTEGTLARVEAMKGQGVEIRSYLPDLLYRYGRNGAAYAELKARVDPSLHRREYPEVSYAVVGDIVTGLMGVSVDARDLSVATRPRLTPDTTWAELLGLGVLGNSIELRHEPGPTSTCANASGPSFYWKATFPGRCAHIAVDGRASPADCATDINGQLVSWVYVRMEPGARRSATPA